MPKPITCSDYCTINCIAHRAKIVARTLRTRFWRKTEAELGEYHFMFKRWKERRTASWILWIISEQSLKINTDLCAYFINKQKAFHVAECTKLMQIARETIIDWRHKDWSANCATIRMLNYDWNKGETRRVDTGRAVRQGCCLSRIIFNMCSECRTWDSLEGSKDFRFGRQ